MIRPMSPSDVNTCIAMGHDMHLESYFKTMDFSPLKLTQLWQMIVAQPDAFCAFVAEKEDKIIGMFVGVCQEHWFGFDKVACDLALYVTPEERGGTTAIRLIKAYEQWARDVGASEIHIGTSTNINSERVTKLFEKMGFSHKAFYLRKRN